MRPDVEAAVVAALEEKFDEQELPYPKRQSVKATVLKDDGAGLSTSMLLRTVELLLDQQEAAFPVPAKDGDLCPVCEAVPRVGQRTADGTAVIFTCADGHRWEPAVPKPLPQPHDEPIVTKADVDATDYKPAAALVLNREWTRQGRCRECRGVNRAFINDRPSEVAGHDVSCPQAALMRIMRLDPLMRPWVEDEVSS